MARVPGGQTCHRVAGQATAVLLAQHVPTTTGNMIGRLPERARRFHVDGDRCRRGHAAACRTPADRGGVQTHETLPARFLLSVEPPLWPDGTSLASLAALPDAAATPYAAIVRAQVAPGDVCVILGAGVR